MPTLSLLIIDLKCIREFNLKFIFNVLFRKYELLLHYQAQAKLSS